jgi:CRP-like cAMP-binding protein
VRWEVLAEIDPADGPGDHFGDLALVDASRRSAAIVAVDRVETLELRYDDLERFRADHPSFERVRLAMLARNVRRLSANLQETMYLAVPARVARRLDELCDLFDGAPIPLTQADRWRGDRQAPPGSWETGGPEQLGGSARDPPEGPMLGSPADHRATFDPLSNPPRRRTPGGAARRTARRRGSSRTAREW